MKPGRELDALVAEKVMGWSLDTFRFGSDGRDVRVGRRLGIQEFEEVPRYSTDISAAWQVVEKMKDKFNLFEVFHQDGRWNCMMQDYCYDKLEKGKNGRSVSESAPHAICLAALKAVGVSVDG